jgi:hypothetical protein
MAVDDDTHVAKLAVRARVDKRRIATDDVTIQVQRHAVAPITMPLFGHPIKSASSVVSDVIVSPH